MIGKCRSSEDLNGVLTMCHISPSGTSHHGTLQDSIDDQEPDVLFAFSRSPDADNRLHDDTYPCEVFENGLVDFMQSGVWLFDPGRRNV